MEMSHDHRDIGDSASAAWFKFRSQEYNQIANESESELKNNRPRTFIGMLNSEMDLPSVRAVMRKMNSKVDLQNNVIMTMVQDIQVLHRKVAIFEQQLLKRTKDDSTDDVIEGMSQLSLQ